MGEVLAAVHPDAIILLHDGCPPEEMGLNAPAGRRDQTLKALACLIPALHARGFAIRLLPPLTEQIDTQMELLASASTVAVSSYALLDFL